MEADMGKRIRITGFLGLWDASLSLFYMLDYLRRRTEALTLEFGAHHIGVATSACCAPGRLLNETTYVQCYSSNPMSRSLQQNAVYTPPHRPNPHSLPQSSQDLEWLRDSISSGAIVAGQIDIRYPQAVLPSHSSLQ